MTLTTRQALAKLEHREGCGRDVKTILDPSGRVITICRACGARIWHDTPPAPKTAPPPVPLRAAYVCRDHLTPVTWKGTGCRECAAAQTGER